MLMKVYLINIWGVDRLRYFMKYTLTFIKSIAKISYITSYVLFGTGATLKFINSKICVAIYNSLSNIVLFPISVFKLICLLNLLTNLAMCIISILSTFRFFGVFVITFCLIIVLTRCELYANQSWEASLQKQFCVPH